MNDIVMRICLFSLIALGSGKSNDEQSSIEPYGNFYLKDLPKDLKKLQYVPFGRD